MTGVKYELKPELNQKYYTYPLGDSEWSELEEMLDDCPYEDYTQNGSVKHLVISYDSETSNYIDSEGNKRPFAFSEMTTFMTEQKVLSVLCRDISDWVEFITRVAKASNTYLSREPMTDKWGGIMYDNNGHIRYKTFQNRYINVYVHNLPFDVEFILSHADVYDVFASTAHKPYYVVLEPGVKMIDTVVLTHKTLDGLGKSLKYFKVRKAVGDFDYDKIRTPETPFTEKEKGYVINDTLVLAAWIMETIQDSYEGKLSNLPMTQTGIVRRFVRKCFAGDLDTIEELYSNGLIPNWLKPRVESYISLAKAPYDNNDHNQHVKDLAKRRNAIKELLGPTGRKFTISKKAYQMMSSAYIGGFTHSNPNHTGETVKDVQSWDFTSSYPTRILSEKFASSDPIAVKVSSDEALKLVDECKNDDVVYLFDYEASEITSKTDYDFYWSSSRCKASEIDDSNGRIAYARNFSTTMTSIDYDIFKRVYYVEKPKITTIYKFRQDYLPLAIIISTLHFYDLKTTLKHVKGREKDYTRYKQMLNSVYGLMVQSPIKDDVAYENGRGYITTKAVDKLDGKLDAYNKSPRRFLYYMWGVEISAYSRHELWRGIMECKNDYVYSDTDSIKVLNADKHKAFIDAYNKEIKAKVNKCLKANGLKPELAAPKDMNGVKHQIGEWDPLDGFYKYFKTLGAKRYIDIDKETDEFQITIAGLSKSKGALYMLNQAGVKHEGFKVVNPAKQYRKLFAYFDNHMSIPASDTGKLAHFYIDNYKSFEVKDYQGKSYRVAAGSGTLLKAVDFSMSLSDQFVAFLKSLADGEEINKDSLLMNALA